MYVCVRAYMCVDLCVCVCVCVCLRVVVIIYVYGEAHFRK